MCSEYKADSDKGSASGIKISFNISVPLFPDIGTHVILKLSIVYTSGYGGWGSFIRYSSGLINVHNVI